MENIVLEPHCLRDLLFFCMHICIVNTELFWFMVVLQNILLYISLPEVVCSRLSPSLFYFFPSFIFFPGKYEVALSKQWYYCPSLLMYLVLFSYILLNFYLLSIFVCSDSMFSGNRNNLFVKRMTCAKKGSPPGQRPLVPMTIELINAKIYEKPLIA